MTAKYSSVWAIALILSIATATREASADQAVRVATWNIQSVGTAGSTQYEAALAILNRIGADVVAINEVSSNADIANFQNLAAAAGYAHTVVPSSNPFGSLRNAFMSTFPILQGVVHSSASLSGDASANDITRLIVEIRVDVPGNSKDLTLVVQHWKSGTGNDDEFRRAGESFRVSQVVAPLDPLTDAFVITGDVNEEIDSVPRSPNPFTSLPSGLPGSFTLGADLVVELVGPGIDNDPFLYLEQHALTLDTFQLDGSDATRPASGRRLDYILLSPVLTSVIPTTEVYDSADEGLPGGLPKFGPPLPLTTSADASDHLLVFADLTVPSLLDEISGLIAFTTPDELCWPAQGGATGYEVARSSDAEFVPSCTLLPFPVTCLTDPEPPLANGVLFYLVRVAAPQVGSWGAASSGAERLFTCP